MASSAILNEKHPGLSVAQIAWPVFLEQVMITLVQYIDTAMIGTIGASATAAIAINKSSIDLVNGIIMAIGVGITALLARGIGAGDTDLTKKMLRQVVFLIGVIGVFSTVLMCSISMEIPQWLGGAPEILSDAGSYMLIISYSMFFKTASILITSVYRSFGDTKTPLKINLIINFVNVIGNFLLIYPSREVTIGGVNFNMYGAGMGVAGAAASTSFATAIGGAIMIMLIFNPKSYLNVSIHDSFKPDLQLLKRTWKISLPTTLERGAMSFTQILLTSLIAGLGTLSLASHHIALTAEAVFFMPGFAFSVAGTTLVGQALGANRKDLALLFSKKTLQISIVLMCFAGVALYNVDYFLVGLFSTDPFVLEKGAFCLRLFAYIQPIQVISIAITGCLRGAGDTKTPFYIVLFSMTLIRMLGSYICVLVFGMGVEAVWYFICIDIIIRAILFTIRYKSKKWLHIQV